MDPLLVLKHSHAPVLLQRLFSLSVLLLPQIPTMSHSALPEVRLKSPFFIEVNNYHPNFNARSIPLILFDDFYLFLANLLFTYLYVYDIFYVSKMEFPQEKKKSVFCLFMILCRTEPSEREQSLPPKICLFGILIILGWLFLRNGRFRKFFFLPPP